jgi:hypothetical protein
VRVKKVRGTFPLTSLLSHGGERKIKVQAFIGGWKGDLNPKH